MSPALLNGRTNLHRPDATHDTSCQERARALLLSDWRTRQRYSLIGQIVFLDVPNHRRVSPGVLRVQPQFAVAEDEEAEALVEPERAPVSVQHVLPALSPRFVGHRVQHQLKRKEQSSWVADSLTQN